jgi:hypothetical protein
MSAATPRVPASAIESPIGAIHALVEELTRIIGVAHALVDAGRHIELEGLDSQVGLLCAKTLDLPMDDGRRVRPRLIALSGSVMALSHALTARVPPHL